MTGLLDRLRELEAQATPARWWEAHGMVLAVVPDAGSCSVGTFSVIADADLIAEVRNALPLLLDVAEWAERLASEMRYFDDHADCKPETCAPLRVLIQVEAALARLREAERAS